SLVRPRVAVCPHRPGPLWCLPPTSPRGQEAGHSQLGLVLRPGSPPRRGGLGLGPAYSALAVLSSGAPNRPVIVAPRAVAIDCALSTSTLATLSAASLRSCDGFWPCSRAICWIDLPVAAIAALIAPLTGATVWSPPLAAVIC